jgi:hypothetical protein
VPGDGAGVGKGRTIAGVIFENYLKGRKRAIWVSVSNDLKYDAERDLRDIGASKIEVHALNKVNTVDTIFIIMHSLAFITVLLYYYVYYCMIYSEWVCMIQLFLL